MNERPDGLLEVHADILTTSDRYKPMLIGRHGAKIKEMGMAARKELELILQTKVFLDLNVRVDEKWPDRYTR